MHPQAGIEAIIDELVLLYDNTSSTSHKTYYSKLALMELCGWLELTMDDIINTYSNNNFTPPSPQEVLENIVTPTHGCNYKDHFRPMLYKIIGYKNLEILEATLKRNGSFSILDSQLSSLWGVRRRAAHTSIAGVAINYQSPSVMKGYLIRLYPVLQQLETELNTF